MLSMMTRCTLGSDTSIFFWHGRWLLQKPLAVVFPALYSHHVKQNDLFVDVLQYGVEMELRNRLTNGATNQLAKTSLFGLTIFARRKMERPSTCGMTISPSVICNLCFLIKKSGGDSPHSVTTSKNYICTLWEIKIFELKREGADCGVVILYFLPSNARAHTIIFKFNIT